MNQYPNLGPIDVDSRRTTEAAVAQHPHSRPGELGKQIVEGKAQPSNTQDIYDALANYILGTKWNSAYGTEMRIGVRAKNELLVYKDTDVVGKGHQDTTSQEIP